MKYFVTLLILTALMTFCICRKSLKEQHEVKDRAAFDEKKDWSFLTRSNEERTFLTEKFVDEEDVFSAAMIKKNFDGDGENDRVLFPTEKSVIVPKVTATAATVKKIPESLLIAMNGIKTADEFLRRFVASDPGTDVESVHSVHSIGPVVLGRKGLSGGPVLLATSEFAGCRPQKTVVKVVESSESLGVFLWPPCVYLNRCGGCCASELMTCRPTAISSVNVTVLQARYTGPRSNPFANEGMRIIPMEQHEKCTCECKELPKDCSPLQEYRRNECRCICANQNEAARCQQLPNKFWDSRDCLCKCRNPTDCSSGLFFSAKTCRCEMLRFPVMARFGRMLPIRNETVEVRREPQPRYEKEESVLHK